MSSRSKRKLNRIKRAKAPKQVSVTPVKLATQGYICKRNTENDISYERWMKDLYGRSV